MKNWKQMAAEVIEKGYMPNNHWEAMLKRHLTRCFPDLVKDLGNDLEPYCQVMTWNAEEFEEMLLDSGTDPHLAREQTMEHLLPMAPEDQDRPARWQSESSEASLEAAALQTLLATPSKNPPPRTIPLT